MISSTSNQKVKELLQLQKKSKVRNQAGVFLVEGVRMLREAPKDRLQKLYVSESCYKRYQKEFEAGQMGCGVTEVLSDTVFAYVSDTKTPQGVLGVVHRMEYSISDLFRRDNPLILVLDGLQDPGNVGTIFRTAEAAGVSGILLSENCVDIYNPKTIRSTMGAVYRMPFLAVQNVAEAVGELKKRGICVYAAHLEGKHSYEQESYLGGTAFLIGNEGNGLSREAEECADTWIRIPMCGEAESLNAAVAAAVLMFEVSRQRREN